VWKEGVKASHTGWLYSRRSTWSRHGIWGFSDNNSTPAGMCKHQTNTCTANPESMPLLLQELTADAAAEYVRTPLQTPC
jgi:hypothetical protein